MRKTSLKHFAEFKGAKICRKLKYKLVEELHSANRAKTGHIFESGGITLKSKCERCLLIDGKFLLAQTLNVEAYIRKIALVLKRHFVELSF